MSYQQQPGYPGYPGSASPGPAPVYHHHPHTNMLAVASLATSLFGLLLCGFPALIGAIMGHVARKQIRQDAEYLRRFLDSNRPADVTPEEQGSLQRVLLPMVTRRNGVALAGIIIGWIGFVLWLAFWVPFAMGFFGAATAPN